MSPTEWVLVVTAVIALLFVGSFTNVVIDRLPVALDAPNEYGDLWDTRPWREVLGGRSRCSSCGTEIGALENVPVASWLVLRGRCRHCGERIPAFHPVVELGVPLLSLGVVWATGWSWRLLPLLLFVPVGLAIIVIDLRTWIVPTRLVWPATAAAVALTAVAAALEGEPSWFVAGAIGLVGLAGPWFAIWWVVGGGFGDVRLCVLLGWVVGVAVGGASWWAPLVAAGIVLASASLLTTVVSVARMQLRGKVQFGPGLVAGAALVVALGEPLRDAFS